MLEGHQGLPQEQPQQQRFDWNKVQIGNIGYQMVYENQQTYVGDKTAGWDLALTPREAHFDDRVTVSTPLQKAGAYLLKAKLADGNTSNIIIWLATIRPS